MSKRIGVKDLFAFEVIKTSAEGVPTYGAPFRIAKAIEVGIQKQVGEAKLYADDALDDYVSEVTGMTLTLNINELTPEIEAKLLGLRVDQLGGVSNGVDNNSPYFAIAFRSKLSNGGYQYRVLYRARFKPTDETFKTKGENVEFQQPTLTCETTIREDLGIFDYALDNSTPERKAVTDKWFEEVQVPKQAA